MNFSEVMELHRTISEFYVKSLENLPNLGVYDFQSGNNYVLCIKMNSANSQFLGFLEDVAHARKLGIRKFRGHLVFYSFGNWNLGKSWSVLS